MSQKASTKTVVLFNQGLHGWYAKVFARHGALLHTTKVHRGRSEAYAAAKEWRDQRKKATVGK